MARPLLSNQEVHDTVLALREAFRAISRIREKHAGGCHIQFPRIPAILSESIIAREIRNGRAPWWKNRSQIRRGGRIADLLVSTRPERVEVKATGRQGFEEFGPKDIKADVLVWLDFGGYFEDGRGSAIAYWLRNPGAVFKRRKKLSLPEFRELAGNRLKIRKVKV